jgi:hypothetical protein
MFQISKKGEDGSSKNRSSEFLETTVIYSEFQMESVSDFVEWVLCEVMMSRCQQVPDHGA